MSFFITEDAGKSGKQSNKKRKQVRNDDLVDPDDYMPKRFGLKYNPPTIVLEYMVMSLGKLYHHKMKLMRLKPDSDVNEMVDYLYSRHGFYIKEETVSRQQLANLITRLQKRMPAETGNNENIQRTEVKAPASKTVKPVVQKHVLSENPIPSSYMPSAASKMAKQKSTPDDDWGNNYSDDDWGNDDDKNKDYDNFDMNKLTLEELKKEKSKMDVEFEKNRKKPGDKDFEYDVRKEFDKGPKED